jgi:hypothetical protein
MRSLCWKYPNKDLVADHRCLFVDFLLMMQTYLANRDVDPGVVSGIKPYPDNADTYKGGNAFTKNGNASIYGLDNVFVPVWQYGPGVVNASLVNIDLMTNVYHARAIGQAFAENELEYSEIDQFTFFRQHIRSSGRFQASARSYVVVSVFDDFHENSTIVGFLIGVLPLDNYFIDVLPQGTGTFTVEVEDNCGARVAYSIEGSKAYMSTEHHAGRNETGRTWHYGSDTDGGCFHSFNAYPSTAFREQYETSNPVVYTSVILLAFGFTAFVYILYDKMVQRRQKKVLSTAARSTAIVKSLFPKGVGQRLIDEAEERDAAKNDTRASFSGQKSHLKEYLTNGAGDWDKRDQPRHSKPLADLFPQTTVRSFDTTDSELSA